MSKEIERKFLVRSSEYRDLAIQKKEMMQGYLSLDPDATVRVRIVDEEAFITVKSRNKGAVRNEWEYSIPVDEGTEMLKTCCKSRLIEKTRHIVEAGDGLKWEIDEFHGSLDGLVVTEIELPEEDYPVILPEFVGKEVTGDPRYYNSSLASL